MNVVINATVVRGSGVASKNLKFQMPHLIWQFPELIKIYTGPSSLSVPTLVVANTADDVAPPNLLKSFANGAKNVQIIEHPGELGVWLQHLGILVGRHAQAHVWPEILSWLKSQTSSVRP